MKKTLNILKYIAVSILTLIILFFVINFFLFIFLNKGFNFKNKYIFKRHNFSISNFMKEQKFRSPIGTQYKKKPAVLLFGCGTIADPTFTEEQSLEGYLSKNSKRTVYNRAVNGGSIQHAIIQIQSRKLDEIIKESSHVIYVLPAIDDAKALVQYPGSIIDRHFLIDKFLYPKYSFNKENKLKLYNAKSPLISGSITNRLISKIKVDTFCSPDNAYFQNLIWAHFDTLQKELKEVNSKIKLTILLYYDSDKDNLFLTQGLNDLGIQLLYAKSLTSIDLIGDPIYRENQMKPTEKAWELLAPLIVKELNL